MREHLILVAIVGLLLGPLYKPLITRARVLGMTRFRSNIANVHGEDSHFIPDTEMCEDLHLHAPSNLLFTACQGDVVSRYSWFPPLENWKNVTGATQGSIVVIDPKTFTSQKLSLTGFSGPFVTHGIDIISGDDPETVFIFAVNHLPNPWHYQSAIPNQHSKNKTRSQIELFRHVLGTSTAEHVRSILSPQIYTPNDIYAVSSTSFYVTNDHHYRTGIMRHVEEVLTQHLAGWSSTVHVEITDLTPTNPSDGLIITTALQGLHNNNGLGKSSPSHLEEVLIVDASGGVLTRAKRNLDPKASKALEIIEQIQLDSTLDNPFYYHDPYATAANNASGYVLAGLARAMALGAEYDKMDRTIPVLVWHVRPKAGGGSAKVGEEERHGDWEKRVLFSDNGLKIRSGSAAVMLPIDPDENGGKKQAWLFVTGFLSGNVIATKVML